MTADDTKQPDEDKGAAEMSEKEIDANLEASFPASDPPSWTLGSDHIPSDDQDDEEKS